MKTEAKLTGQSLSSLVKGALLGPAGLGLTLGIVSSLVLRYVDSIGSLIGRTSEGEKAQKRFSEALAASGDIFKESFKKVGELRESIEAAKNGLHQRTKLLRNSMNRLAKQLAR